METGDDPYDILGVSPRASTEDIKKSYRKLALKHHPDRESDPVLKQKAQDRFAKISAAYEILSDEKRRRRYDRLQDDQEEQTGQAAGFDQNRVDICFNSPYEVWKRDFEEQFGFPYPGAQYDFDTTTKHLEQDKSSKKKKNTKRLTADPRHSTSAKPDRVNDYDTFNSNNKKSSSSKNNNNNNYNPNDKFGRQVPDYYSDPSDDDSSSSSDSSVEQGAAVPEKKKKSMFSNPFKKSSDSTQIVPRNGKSSNNNRNSNSNSTALAKRSQNSSNNSENRLVKSYGSNPNDNRPTSMETTEKKIHHDDGTVETITETKFQRPDGSTETVRTTDKGHKRPDWQGKVAPKHKQLTNGSNGNNSPRKALTNGDNNRRSSKSSSSSKNKPLALTNGSSSRNGSSTSTQLVRHRESRPY